MGEMDLCAALHADDRHRLASLLGPVLHALPGNDREAAFESLRKWLVAQDCVADVVVVPGMLRSQPPIKELHVILEGSDPPQHRSIGVRVTPFGYEFDVK